MIWSSVGLKFLCHIFFLKKLNENFFKLYSTIFKNFIHMTSYSPHNNSSFLTLILSPPYLSLLTGNHKFFLVSVSAFLGILSRDSLAWSSVSNRVGCKSFDDQFYHALIKWLFKRSMYFSPQTPKKRLSESYSCLLFLSFFCPPMGESMGFENWWAWKQERVGFVP